MKFLSFLQFGGMIYCVSFVGIKSDRTKGGPLSQIKTSSSNKYIFPNTFGNGGQWMEA